ncbi:hypothetical protein BDV12DRAFT_206461 [Aspergillus spectabilis]
MVKFLMLPTEIISRIFSRCDLSSRKALRLASRRLGQIGQRSVFHTAIIYLNTYDLDADLDELCEREDDSDDDTDFPIQFYNLFDRLKEFPRLQSIVLRFHKEAVWETSYWVDVPQEFEQREAIMKRAMKIFASLPRPLQELAIRDLQNVNTTDPTVAADIAKVLGSLKSLRLNITNERREFHAELDFQREEPHVFYPALPSVCLKPTTASLQHLTIYSSLYCGFYPKLDFRDIHFPRLKSLALRNYGFVHDSQLKWILSHAATLSELYLDDCAIIYEGFNDNFYASYSKRWVDYFRAFKDGLPHLQHFRYGHGEGWFEGDEAAPFERETEIKNGFHEESYRVCCDGFGPGPYMSELVYRMESEQDNNHVDHEPADKVGPTENDKEAFRELCAKLGQTIPDFKDY